MNTANNDELRAARSFVVCLLALLISNSSLLAQTQLKYSNFDQWITRHVKESAIIGGNTQTLYEIGPTGTWDGKKPYVNQGGSPWASSNIMAKVAGVVKTNVSVYPEQRGNGKCVKLVSHIVGVKVLGLVNIHVLAAGSIYVGRMIEPITSSSNPFGKLDYGKNQTRIARLDKEFGAGYGQRILGWQVRGTDGEFEYARVTSSSYSGVEAELGLVFRMGGFAIMAGAQTIMFKYYEANVGIGVMF